MVIIFYLIFHLQDLIIGKVVPANLVPSFDGGQAMAQFELVHYNWDLNNKTNFKVFGLFERFTLPEAYGTPIVSLGLYLFQIHLLSFISMHQGYRD